jgi:hypothetical protein
VLGTRFVLALHPFTLGAPAQTQAALSEDLNVRRHLADEARNAGRWGAERFGPGKNYMVPWSKIVYHLNGLWTALPVAADPDLLVWASRNKVDYIVLENKGERSGMEPGHIPGLEHAGRYRSASFPYSVDFYRLSAR